MQTKEVTEPTLRQRLQSFTTSMPEVSTRMGRTYLSLKGAFFDLTATFSGPAPFLYQVTMQVTTAAYTEMKAFAGAIPPRGASLDKAVVAQWQSAWWGLLGHLQLRPAKGTSPGVSVRFTGIMPGRKIIVLTRS